jgi:hypothetical protein
MAGAKIALTAVSGELQNDGNGNAKVNLPTDLDEAGIAQIGFKRTTGRGNIAKVTQNGELAIAENTVLFNAEFNASAVSSLLNNQFNNAVSTMTLLVTGGFLRFNSGIVTTINTGATIHSWEIFQVQDGVSNKLRVSMRHLNGAIANKQFDLGFGFYDIANQQNNPMNEFVGFRWTQAGALIGVMEYTLGGAVTAVTTNINGGVPYSDNVTHTYDVIINEDGVEFWVDDVCQGFIASQPDAPGVSKGSGYPIIARLLNGGSAPSSAPVFDIGGMTVSRRGPANQIPRGALQAMQGRHILTPQNGLQTANGALSVSPTSGTGPSGITATNITPALGNALGGYFRLNGAAIVSTGHTEYLINSFGNPGIPEGIGAANNGRAMIITDLMISPLVVSTVLVGGGFTAEWFLAIGSTGVSLATGDANGGGSIGTKSPKRMPLPIVDTLGAAAAAGTVSTRAGEPGLINFETPLVINPGEFIQIGFRTLFVGAAVTSGTIDGGIGINGYWA